MRRSLCVLLLVLSLAPAAALAQDQRCFPETNQCISGRIRTFWEENGGLQVFGFPTGPQHEEQIEGKPFQVQLFERNRLELHPENQPPYDVLLGRLGVDRLTQQSRDWFTFPKSSGQQPDCLFFESTGHNVCGAVLSTWRGSGLEFDGQEGKSQEENTALFGLPISDLQTETIEGKEYQVQWFERARFELHPENQPPYNVLLGLLGNEIRDNAAPPAPLQPTSAPQPAPPPQVSGPNPPCNQNALAPAEGAQAWMTVANPARRSDITLCVRLIVGGRAVAGAQASGVAHYKSTDTALGPAATGGDGVAAITFNVGGPTPGYMVKVDVTVTNAGQTYTAQTSFTPQ